MFFRPLNFAQRCFSDLWSLMFFWPLPQTNNRILFHMTLPTVEGIRKNISFNRLRLLYYFVLLCSLCCCSTNRFVFSYRFELNNVLTKLGLRILVRNSSNF
jgi:hypothetical protein